MRGLALAAMTIVLVGCVHAPPNEPASASNNSTAAPGAPGGPMPGMMENMTMGMGERGPLVTERFVLNANHGMDFVDPNAKEAPTAASVPEAFTGAAFFTSQDPASSLPPWEGPEAQRTFEIMKDVTITLKFTVAQPATGVTKAFQFPPVGGWFGTKERYAVFFTAPDAPDTVQPGQTYVVRAVAKMPETGLFVAKGEHLALHTFLAYQTADNSPPVYVLGGADPAGMAVPHVHFNISAPNATVVLDKSGTLSNNPQQSTSSDMTPTDLAFDVPAGTVYVVASVTSAPAGASAGHFDVDLEIRSGTTVLGAGGGPGPHEVVEIGPTALAKANGKLTAHIAGASPTGGTFKVTVTAYGA